MNLFLTCFVFITIVILVVHFFNTGQSIIYIILWLFAAVSIFTSYDLLNLFTRLFPVEEFGTFGKRLSKLFVGFTSITVAHQGFLYYYLHDLEAKPEKWKASYPKFYNSSFEKTIRFLAFIFLLMAVDKIPFVKEYINTYCTGNLCTEKQNVLIISSSILFLLLVIYDLVAGVRCKKWASREYLMHIGGDFIALVFWSILAYKVIFTEQRTMGDLALVPLFIGLAYFAFIAIRIIRSLFTLEIK